MTINSIPAVLQTAIQQGYLEKEFKDGLQSALGYRAIADREQIAINIGETVTKTRAGLKAPATTPLLASGNTNLDNGLTPTPFTVEQYTLGMNSYGDTIDLNVVTSQVGIANQFLRNAKTNAIQARQTLDRLARNALFGAYLGGNTRVRTTLGAPATTISVDDIRGFGTVLVNGAMVAVSSTNVASVTVGSDVYSLSGVSADATNVSTALITGGISGTLTFTSNVTVADATALNCVIHANGPQIIRPNGKYIGALSSTYASTAATSALAATDLLSLGTIEDAVANLRANTGIVDESFNLYLDTVSWRQLFADADFKQIFQGQYGAAPIKDMSVFHLMGVNFIPTTEAFIQLASGTTIRTRRPILVAQGALIEGDYAGMEDVAHSVSNDNAEVQRIDDIVQVVRGPLDRLQQIIAQSWYWMGGFAAPTDATANSSIIPTAGSQYLKRAIVIEHAG